MIVYVATNKINGKMYIGATTLPLNKRKRLHLYSKDTIPFHTALKKYGIDGFRWEIIEVVSDKETLYKRERYYIAYYDSINTGYNRQTGGIKNFITAEETKEKLSKLNEGKNNPMYGVHILGKDHSNYGTYRSMETRQKISESLKEYWKNKKAIK